MLLRSHSLKQELFNCTRLILNNATGIIFFCKIASGGNAREEVLISRIKIKHQGEQFFFFNIYLIEPASVPRYAGLCNYNQQILGQTLSVVAVRLEEHAFTHGQLYFAASRVGDHQYLYFALIISVSRKSRNVVYKEFVWTDEVVSTPTEVPLTCSLLNSDQPM